MNVLPIIIIMICGAAAVAFNKLTIAAAAVGSLIGIAIYLGIGWIGIVFMGAFFLLGTAATSWGRKEKEKIGMAQEAKGRRTAGQVIANGGAGGMLGLIAWYFPQHAELFTVMIAASFSSATADTLSSELGTIYGKRFYDILNFKKGERGRDGVISIEGLLFGVAGSLIIALLHTIHFGWHSYSFLIIVAGTIGNLSDSLLGATLERSGSLGNNTVNFLNTTVAALFMLLVF